MKKSILIKEKGDSVLLKENVIHALSGGKEYTFDLSSVNVIFLVTTDEGCVCDDLYIKIDAESAEMIIMSEHECFWPFLFEQLGKALELDYQKIIEAQFSVDNKEFEIYRNAKNAESG